MRFRALIIYCLFLGSTIVSAQVGISSDELKIFHLLNQERTRAGLPPFQWNYQLAESARAHTQLLASRQALSHQFPGETILGERIGATGLRFDEAAENVAAGGAVDDIHSHLMNSPLHRANILNPDYNSVGLAFIPSGDELYLTEDFARTLPSYSEEQFRAAVIAALNKAREAHGITPITVNAKSRLHEFACSDSTDTQHMLQDLPNALTLVIYTGATPEKLSPSMEKAAADRSLRRMDLAVCFKPGKEHGYGSFRIIGAFYP